MTAFLQTMAAFASLCLISAFVARHSRMPAGLAPLPVCCGAMVWLVLWGYAGLLLPAAVALLCAGAVAALFFVITAKRGGFRKLLSPAFVLFCVAGTAFILLFAVRQPMAQEWDEFSLWMTAVKLSKENHVIYSAAPMGWPWLGTQKPGLPTFSYFFNVLGSFAAWRVYAAYGVLLAAVWAAAVGVLSWKHWRLLAPSALVMFLLPFFTVYLRDIYCNYTYLSAYADIPMGVLCCGALAWYYHTAALRRQQPAGAWACSAVGVSLGRKPWSAAPLQAYGSPLWPLCFVLMAIALCKDTGLPLALIVAGIALADLLLCQGEARGTRLRAAMPKVGLGCLWVGSTASMFVLSGRYIGSLGVASGAVSTTSEGAAVTQIGMLIEGTKLFLGLPAGEIGAQYAEKFAAVRSEMIALFLPGESSSITMVGSGLAVLLLVLLLVGAAVVLCRGKRARRTALLYGILSTLGFFAYYIFIGYTYVFVFKTGITDYNRYVNTYNVMWVGGAFVVLLLAAARGSKWSKGRTWWLAGGLGVAALGALALFAAGYGSRKMLLLLFLACACAIGAVLLARKRLPSFRSGLSLLVVLLAVAFQLRFLQMVQLQLSVIDYPEVVYNEARAIASKASAAKAVLQKEDTVYFVNTQDNGYYWFANSYEFLPVLLQYSHGGGSFADVVRAKEAGGAGVSIHRSLEEFAAELSFCDYVYVDKAGAAFWEGYKDLFADGGAAWAAGTTLLYQVQITGTPAYTQVTLADLAGAGTENQQEPDGTVRPNEKGQRGETPRRKLVNAAQTLQLVPVTMEVPAL